MQIKIKIPRWLASFLKGAGSILEICPPPQQNYTERFGTDEEQMASDWKKVGDDIQKAIDEVNKEVKNQNHPK